MRRKASKDFHGDAYRSISTEEVQSWLVDQRGKDSLVKVEVKVIIDDKKRKSKSKKEAD